MDNKRNLTGANNNFYGKHHTAESKLKMSLSGKKRCAEGRGGFFKKGERPPQWVIEKARLYRMGKPLTEEHKRKISEANSGEKNWRWMKNRDLLKKKQERNDPAYFEWRYQVFKRDRHECKMNDNNCFGDVVAHHIRGWNKYPELRYEIGNGITLCEFHHPRKRQKETEMIPIFEIIINKK